MATCARCGASYEGDDHACVERGTVRLRPGGNAETDDLIGRRLGGYVVEKAIGKGGMGLVYLATHPVLGTKVAVKVIRSEHAADEELRRRFMDEARALAALDDPRIVAIRDLSLLPDGRAYLVMEYVEGELLSRRLTGPLPPETAVAIERELLAGLAAAHARGIVHRDIKPSNVMLVGDRLKLLDFGIAKLRDRPAGGTTQAGAVIGTPGYMPPEQASARAELGPTADVYAAGIVLYEMLAGHRPFDAASEDDWVEVLVRQRTQDPPPIAGAPPWLDAVVRRALARDPKERFASAAEMLAALDGTRRRRRPLGWLAAALLGFGVVGGVATWRIAGGPHEGPRDAAEVAVVPAPVPTRDAMPPVPDAGVMAPADAAAVVTKSPRDAAVAERPRDPAIVAQVVAPPTAAPPPHVDVMAYRATADQLARRIAGDAQLIAISAHDVLPDGMAELGEVTYRYRSPAKSALGPDELAGRPRPCEVLVAVTPGHVVVSPVSSVECKDPFVTPRCSVGKVLALAAARGAPAKTVAWLSVDHADHWLANKAACAALPAARKKADWGDGRCDVWDEQTEWRVTMANKTVLVPDECP